MARADADHPLLPSVFDRLLIDEPAKDGVPQREASLWWSKDTLRNGVRRDLETLLNTRQRCLSRPEHLDELDRSLISYGAPDFSGANLSSRTQKENFRAEVEQTIRTFEPRFKSVRVTLADSDGVARTLRFRIDVLMHADPVPVQLLFDSLLDPGSRHFSVSGK
ncbi:MAG: type VI secretion system baseplate subunit TssE [Rhodospirillaceae bacterium]